MDPLSAASQVNKTVVRALEVLDLLAASDGALHLKEIALSLDRPESTTHRLLASLASKGYVEHHRHDGRYHLGWKVLLLADSFGRYTHLLNLMRPFLKSLVEMVGETVSLSVRSGMEVMYLDSLSPLQTISVRLPVGLRVPAHASAVGKVQLAFLPQPEIERLLGEHVLEAFTPATITSLAELQAELERIRATGYATDVGEYWEDVRCVAAPVFNGIGELVAGVSIAWLRGGARSGQEREFALALLDVCRWMSSELGA